MKSKEEIDAFWDLESLLPKKKPPSVSRPAAPPVTVTVTQDTPPAPHAAADETRLTQKPDAAPAVVESYSPKSNPFLLSVTLSRKKTAYSFYGHFVRDAHRYFDEVGNADAPYIPFFSYIPQYSQLSDAQRAYYFRFRSAVRRREVIKTDFSYLMLLVYEVLNTPDLLSPDVGVFTLTFLWQSYRKAFPQMDKYLAAWLPDYCLMHKIPCPNAALAPILSEVLAAADFKEFYLGDASDLTEAGLEAMVALLSDYRYRYSRYATPELLPRFEKAMHGALFPVIARLLSEENIGVLATERKKEHEAFTGSLCAHNLRCHISVTYRPFSETPRVRTLLTQAVKYTENKLRAEMAVKSRLSVTGLPPEYKAMINRYFEENGTPRAKKNELLSEEARAYLKLYEAESEGISLEGAARIEESSWETTRLLVADEEAEEELVFSTHNEKQQDTEEYIPTGNEIEAKNNSKIPTFELEEETEPKNVLQSEYGLSENAVSFLRILCTEGRRAALSFAKSVGIPHFSLVEEINGAFYTHFGDTVIEEDGIVSDYEEEILAFFSA